MLLRNRPVLKLGAGGTSYSFYSATKNRVRDRDNLREEEEGDELEWIIDEEDNCLILRKP